MVIKKEVLLTNIGILIIVVMALVASATSEEFNPDYPVGTPRSQGGGYVTQANDGDGWYNAQDWQVNNSDYGGYHPGEDWNDERGGSSDVDAPVYAIANGVVTAISSNVQGGQGIAIKHTLPNGESIYSVYIHIAIKSGLSVGSGVGQGEQIGTIAVISAPHLHFEIRTKPVNPQDWYPNDNGKGYYASKEALYADGFTVNPSDFIDSHRNIGPAKLNQPTPVTLTLYVRDGSASGPIIPGAQVTGQDGSGNRFQVITGDLGYVTITETPGTWSITASAPAFQTKSWNQIITDNSTRHAFLQAVQQPESVASAAPGSKSSVVGKWNVVWEYPIQTMQFVMIFNTDGTFNRPKVYHTNPDYSMDATTGRWTQNGDSVSWTDSSVYGRVGRTLWKTITGFSFVGTIHMNSMNGNCMQGNSNGGSWSAERVGTASSESTTPMNVAPSSTQKPITILPSTQ